MSDTPRTDAAEVDGHGIALSSGEGQENLRNIASGVGGFQTFVPASFARTLERELIAALRALPQENSAGSGGGPVGAVPAGWQLVADGLPKALNPSEGFLTWDGDMIRIEATHPDWWNRMSDLGAQYDGPKVTHWRPLPPPPADSEEQKG